MTDEHRDRDHQEFEAAGDEVVRANVLLNRYEREKRAAAEAWLRERLEARRQGVDRRRALYRPKREGRGLVGCRSRS